MLVAHVADTHINADATAATLDEQVAWLKWIGDDAAAQGADLLVHAGDVFDGLSSPAERNAAIQVFTSWAEHFPVVVVYGNHDRPQDLDFLSALRSSCKITVHDHPGHLNVAGLEVVTLPWPRKAHLVAAMGTTSALEATETAKQAMQAVLSGLCAVLDGSKPSVLVGHVELGMALTDSGQPVAGKADIELSEGDLSDVGTDAVLLGHIHKRQAFGKISYAGSPRQMTFGEDQLKGYQLVDVQRGKDPRIEFRASPARELVNVNLEWDAETAKLRPDAGEDEAAMANVAGRAIRLRYEVQETSRAQAGEQADALRKTWLESGAHSVKIDATVISTTRVRAEAVAKAKTTAEKLDAYWTAREQRPEREPQILLKLRDLEAEVRS
jgi:exonuclease SbcD